MTTKSDCGQAAYFYYFFSSLKAIATPVCQVSQHFSAYVYSPWLPGLNFEFEKSPPVLSSKGPLYFCMKANEFLCQILLSCVLQQQGATKCKEQSLPGGHGLELKYFSLCTCLLNANKHIIDLKVRLRKVRTQN